MHQRSVKRAQARAGPGETPRGSSRRKVLPQRLGDAEGHSRGFSRSQAELERARRIARRFAPRLKSEQRGALYRECQVAVARVRSRRVS